MTDLARRFLHVNLNCESLKRTEDFFTETLGLRARMRTDPKIPTDGSILGLSGETWCETAFLYDVRGARKGCALEAIEFSSPPLARDACLDPVRPGIRSALFFVADLDATRRRARSLGADVGPQITGLCSGGPAFLVSGPDGTVIEIAESPQPSSGGMFSGVRIATADAVAMREFLCAIGFTEVRAATKVAISAAQLSPTGSAAPTDCLMSRYALAEDADTFTVTVVEHPDTESQPVPWGGNRQGLYRCALRVEHLGTALERLPAFVEQMGEPVWCPLPGTKIEGLHIAFLRSPDGVVFEFVERPLRYF